MSFDGDLKRFSGALAQTGVSLLPAVGAAVFNSVVFGSPITGAPGQPVDEGHLRASWQLTFPSPTEALIATKSPYARDNEDGVRADGRPYVQRSPVGGRHSVKLTEQHIDKLVADEARKMGAA